MGIDDEPRMRRLYVEWLLGALVIVGIVVVVRAFL
jgi:hypothetical protein